MRDQEFVYYLSRVLGLASPFPHKQPELARRGSWSHRHLSALLDEARMDRLPAIDDLPAFLRRIMENTIEARLDAMRPYFKSFGLPQTEIDLARELDAKDAETTLAWFLASMTVRVRKPGSDLREGWLPWLLKQGRVLCTEFCIGCRMDYCPRRPAVVQPDALLFDDSTNTLWDFDLKGTTKPVSTRAQTIAIDFQTWLRLSLISTCLPRIIDRFMLPSDTKFGGIKHLLLQTPTITFGQNDRPYAFAVEGPTRSGVNGWAAKDDKGWNVTIQRGADAKIPLEGALGMTEEEAVKELHEACGRKPEKVYASEPSFSHYLKRCTDYLNGRGDHADLAVQWDGTPPIQTSTTRLSYLEEISGELRAKGKALHQLATRRPHPHNFPRHDLDPSSPYFDFLFTPVALWPEVAQRNRLCCLPRELPFWSIKATEIILQPAPETLR